MLEREGRVAELLRTGLVELLFSEGGADNLEALVVETDLPFDLPLGVAEDG